MPRFAANLTLMYNEVPFLERFALAARDGFEAVEFLFPYAWEAEAIREQLERHALTAVLHNLPAGDWSAGERGIACLPERGAEFRDGVELALRYATALGVRQVNCLAGIRPRELAEDTAWQTLCAHVEYASQRLATAGLTLNLEAINSRVDMPGFLLDTPDKVLEVLRCVGAPNLRLQFDVYHVQIMCGDLCRRLRDALPHIGHIQFADNPGRAQPGTGEINFGAIFRHLDAIGYSGWVSAEYVPRGPTGDSLGWLRDWLTGSPAS